MRTKRVGKFDTLTHIAVYWDAELECWYSIQIGKKKEVLTAALRAQSKGTTDVRCFKLSNEVNLDDYRYINKTGEIEPKE